MTDIYPNCTAAELQQQFDDKIKAHLRHYYWDCLGLYDWENRLEARKNELARSKAILKAIEHIASFSLQGKKMLDIGCGWGGFVVAAAQMGASVSGCDVDAEVLDVAGLRAKLNGVWPALICAPAEKLPYDDNEFDYVQSICVLEHVKNVALAVKEMVRVLKKGGIAFIEAPNYCLPIEPHYKIIFPPKCPKCLAKIYLKLLARPAEFIDTINYIDYKMIKHLFEDSGTVVNDVFNEYAGLFDKFYSIENKPVYDFCKKVSIWSYRALASKVMGRMSTLTVKFYSRFLKINPVYFLIRKN
jgi:ubiquinone/menaquinone biosynthesis C-methylase UbiE